MNTYNQIAINFWSKAIKIYGFIEENLFFDMVLSKFTQDVSFSYN